MSKSFLIDLSDAALQLSSIFSSMVGKERLTATPENFRDSLKYLVDRALSSYVPYKTSEADRDKLLEMLPVMVAETLNTNLEDGDYAEIFDPEEVSVSSELLSQLCDISETEVKELIITVNTIVSRKLIELDYVVSTDTEECSIFVIKNENAKMPFLYTVDIMEM